MNKKNTFVWTAIVAGLIIAGIIIFVLTAPHNTVNYVNAEEVAQVRIRNGNNGESVLLEADAEETKELLNVLKEIKCTKVDEFDQTGWCYMITMFDKEGDLMERVLFISAMLCEIDDRKYEIDQLDGEKVFALIEKMY
ncbi:MAG: hypothetical protein IKO30_06935 [Lachnospiraceae bacterium]|nr:hypothetical protein [Lachnospiraceae bacterium]